MHVVIVRAEWCMAGLCAMLQQHWYWRKYPVECLFMQRHQAATRGYAQK